MNQLAKDQIERSEILKQGKDVETHLDKPNQLKLWAPETALAWHTRTGNSQLES